MSASHRGTALVPTEAAPRYLKQLVSHLGRKAGVQDEGDGQRLMFGPDSCLLTARPDALHLEASGASPEGLARVEDVVGRHLERFGQRDGLTVRWQDVPVRSRPAAG